MELVRRMLVRRGQPAFHPDSAQVSLDLGSRAFGVIRGGAHWDQTVVSITNVSRSQLTVDLEVLSGLCPSGSAVAQFAHEGCVDLLEDRVYGPGSRASLTAGQTIWLCLEAERREPELPRREADSPSPSLR